MLIGMRSVSMPEGCHMMAIYGVHGGRGNRRLEERGELQWLWLCLLHNLVEW